MRQEVGSRGALLGNRLVAMGAVVADGRAQDQQALARRSLEERSRQAARGKNPAGVKSLFARARPAFVGDALAGEVDDDVGVGQGAVPGPG